MTHATRGAVIARRAAATHLDPFKTAQVMYQLWLGAALMTKLAQDKAPLHLALETTKQLLQPIQE